MPWKARARRAPRSLFEQKAADRRQTIRTRFQGGHMPAFRVLHVDDDPDIREVVEGSLALDPDLVTRSCASGGEALAVAAGWLPDLILLDVMMPEMDGPATLARFRGNPRTADIPIVFMTARAQSRE